MISCGRAKTIQIRRRILRKFSEVKKKTLLCQTWKSTGIFKYIFKRHCPDYAHARKTFFFFLKRLVTILSLAPPPGDLESLFHSPYCFCEGKLFSAVNLWHLTYPPLWLLAHKAFAESFHFSRLAAMVLASLRPMIPILLSFFIFQPCASSWSLVFLFFCFLLVPKSLLCCSRCFGPVLVYVRSCLIFHHRSFQWLFSTDMPLSLDL